jgi:hypothetical protein
LEKRKEHHRKDLFHQHFSIQEHSVCSVEGKALLLWLMKQMWQQQLRESFTYQDSI